MIQSFKCKETEKLWHEQSNRKLPHALQRFGLRKLLMLDAAVELDELRKLPGNRLEVLQGKRLGQYSIRINNQ